MQSPLGLCKENNSFVVVAFEIELKLLLTYLILRKIRIGIYIFVEERKSHFEKNDKIQKFKIFEH